MTKSKSAHPKHHLHQHPLIFVGIFLVAALGFLAILVADAGEPDHGSGGTPGQATGFECERGVPEGFTLSDIEGKSLAEAEQWAAAKGWTVRPTVIDGEPKAMTMDYNPDRINVQLEAGVVIRYCGNG